MCYRYIRYVVMALYFCGILGFILDDKTTIFIRSYYVIMNITNITFILWSIFYVKR